MKLINNPKLSGQTLIETVAAIFILVMGVSAAVGLAVYALNTSTSITKQIVGTGLAREGLEAVRNMRDTNWLQGTLSTDCTGFPSGTAKCFKAWDTTPYCIDSGNNAGNCNPSSGPTDYFLQFDSSPSNPDVSYWTLKKSTGGSTKFGLLFTASPVNSGFFYTGSGGVECSGSVSGISDFCRKIVVSQVTTAPYNTTDQSDVGPMLLIRSQVWWVDKKCARSADWPGLGKCSTELDTYLTNWKNYVN